MSPKSGMAPENRVEELELLLRYRHGLGMQSQFFDALTADGKLLGSHCPKCCDRRCPPRLLCPADHAQTEIFELPGEGTLVRATRGQTGTLAGLGSQEACFGEVALDGVSNRVFARIVGVKSDVAGGVRVRLERLDREILHPVQTLVFGPCD